MSFPFHTCIFLCPTITTPSFPRTAIAVTPAPEIALNAYSIWYNFPSGEKMVSARSVGGIVVDYSIDVLVRIV